MKTGLLWYDGDSQRSLHEKIRQAAQRYRQKYGRTPTVCYVHPSALAGQAVPELGLDCRFEDCSTTIWVIAAPSVLLHHFWLGDGDPPSLRVVARTGDSPQLEEGQSGERPRRQAQPEKRLQRSARRARA